MEMAFAQHIPETRSVMLHAVPLFHVTGEGMLTRSIVVGQKLVFMRKWSPETAMDLILAEGVNNLTG
jgi:acyl-CoA synthetase (AMP-forming)/AMP-acid ligase II